MLRDCQSFNILTWKCASRHSGVQFFDIGTSKSASDLMCFEHFDLKMRFWPQRRAIFRQLKYKRCSDLMCFVLFDLKMRFSPQRRAIFRHQKCKKCSEADVSFSHFHFKMCFSPQRCAIFRHQKCKKCSEADVLCTFSLQNVLFATAACKF